MREQTPGPSKLPLRRQWSETLLMCLIFLFCFCFFLISIFLLLSCVLFFFPSTRYTYSIAESVPMISPLGVPRVLGRQQKRLSQGNKKIKKMKISYFVVATFMHFESQVWQQSSDSFIVVWSLHPRRSSPLPDCSASPMFCRRCWQSVCEAFQRGP